MKESPRMKKFIKNVSTGWTYKEKDNFYRSVNYLEKINDVCMCIILLNPFIMIPASIFGICMGLFGFFILIGEPDYPTIDPSSYDYFYPL